MLKLFSFSNDASANGRFESKELRLECVERWISGVFYHAGALLSVFELLLRSRELDLHILRGIVVGMLARRLDFEWLLMQRH